MNKDEKQYPLVKCAICNQEMKKITNTHLINKHHITGEMYEHNFPTAKRENEQLGFDRVKHLRNKSYEEVYGKEKSNKIKQIRSIQTTQQHKDKYKLEDKKCEVCEKTFLSRVNNKQKYCSIKCEYEALRKEKTQIKCRNCNNEFKDFIWSKKLYCCDRCENDYKRTHKSYVETQTGFICRTCGKEFQDNIIRLDNDKVFCSSECRKKYNGVHRYFDYKTKALQAYGKLCNRCNSDKNIMVHHKDGNKMNNDIDNLEVLCAVCHIKLHNQIGILSKQFVGESDIETGMIYILKGLNKAFGLDITNENFRLTPKRVARAYYEIFQGINAENELKNIAETDFPSDYDGMVISEGIHVFSMCPHHFLPVEYIVNVGYLPNKKTVGISKLSRVVELLAKQPELQETFTKKIVNVLERELQPNGVMVEVKGRHFCMIMRGVKQIEGWTKTSSCSGAFKKDQATRQEFTSLVRQK